MAFFDLFRSKKKVVLPGATFRCPRCHKVTAIQSAAWCDGFRFCPDCGKLPYRELMDSLPQCPACGRHFLHRDMHSYNGVNYCLFCTVYLSQRFTGGSHSLVERATGAHLVHILIFDWMTRTTFIRGSVPEDAEQFIILQLSDRVEIFWHYTVYWCSDPNQESVTGTMELPADYFATHTREEFLAFIKQQPWGALYVRNIARDERLDALFTRN